MAAGARRSGPFFLKPKSISVLKTWTADNDPCSFQTETGVTPTIINKHELRCMALKRSGHHAILNWIMANVDGTYCFINNCRTSRNPYRQALRSTNLDRSLITNVEGFSLTDEFAGVHAPKDYLLYNYEEKRLEEIDSETFRKKRDSWLGPSEQIHDLIVLRDPFNNIASRLVMEDKRRSFRHLGPSVGELTTSDLRRLMARPTKLASKLARRLRRKGAKKAEGRMIVQFAVDIFKEYAREYLGETNRLPNKLPVNYNRWFSDSDYREQLASKLGLASADRGLGRVAKWGSGSSFDNRSLDGSAEQMEVLTRWKRVADDPRFKAVVDDAELHALTERIFGRVMQP